jgi:hypothetical protein
MNYEKPMRRPFSNESGWYYIILAIILAIGTLPLFWISYICIKTGEYWSLISVGIILIVNSFSVYGLFCKARKKFQEDRNK